MPAAVDPSAASPALRILVATDSVEDELLATARDLCEELAHQGAEPLLLHGWPDAPDINAVSRQAGVGFPILRAASPTISAPAIGATIEADVAIVIDGEVMALAEPLLEAGLPTFGWLTGHRSDPIGDRRIDRRISFIAGSDAIGRWAEARYGVASARIDWPMLRARPARQAQGPYVVAIGPSRRHGVETLFRIAGQRPNVPFRLIETPNTAPEWRLDCFRRAAHVGNLEWRSLDFDIETALADARLLLVAQSEGLEVPRILLIAQRMGVPILTSNVGSIPMAVSNGGAVVERDAPLGAWLDAFDRVYRDEAEHAVLAKAALLAAAASQRQAATVSAQLMAAIRQRMMEAGRPLYGAV